ncbi:hypothetical protein [Parasitella parasitica]|uniref:EH domain-containing protein n=1 Tax=Parasitella parasitica TaxID=35722 RepID=A0A0B7NJB2_9FUNG|nr:hypothetical protein [Parasitella parasitica]
MYKLFKRHHQESLEKRSGVFIKRQEESKRLNSQQEFNIKALTATPQVQLDDLTNVEASAYQAWWKDLDPFCSDKADNQTVLNFVSGCGLPDHRLEEILALFQNEKQVLTKEHFFAVLRLIAHAQNGRTANRNLVFLGAQLPRFQTQAIDPIIKRSQASEIGVSRLDNSISKQNSTNTNSWKVKSNKIPSWMPPTDETACVQSTMLPNATLTTSKLYNPAHISHSRSRSVPYNFFSKFDDNSDINQTSDDSLDLLKTPETHRPSKHSSHVSMDAGSLQKIINTGQSLLLTQGFQPKFNDDTDTATVSSSESGTRSGYHDKVEQAPNNNFNPYLIATDANPFETDDSSSTTPTQTPQISAIRNTKTHNTCMNSEHIPPPPVPPQSTKPTYPKYARRAIFQ